MLFADRSHSKILLAFAAILAMLALSMPHALAEEEQEAAGQSEATEGDEAPQNDESGEAAPGEKQAKDADAPSFEAVMRLNREPVSDKETGAPQGEPDRAAEEGATATVPLAEYSELARRVEALRRAKLAATIEPVVLGAASYEGEVERSVLALRLKLIVTLSGDGLKFVPLVGDDVALVSAEADGKPISVTRRHGYHVWVTTKNTKNTNTKNTKEAVALSLSLLVGARGGRGSIEYAFRAARTPSTRIVVKLPSEGLSPRFDGAVESDVRAEKGGTTVRATLAPATEVRVVGFRDVGAGEAGGTGARPGAESAGESARAFAEAISLLSVDERSIELFTVMRYTILRGAMQSFDVALPEGLDLVSAEGEGAFHYAVERKDDKTIIHGETALPIEGSYELSLRLKRRVSADRGALGVRLPHCLGVEREHGWIAVEVPGKLRIAETSKSDLVAVTVAELPAEARSNAVSPVLKAYRYYADAPVLGLSVERLPEQDLEEGAIDAVEATSVLAAEGKLVTVLRIALRNASRPSLAVTLPPSTEVRSALRDGEPVRPSRDEAGRLLLPLDRSGGEGHDEPILLEVVLESSAAPMGLFGAPDLALPALDLGAATLKWRLYLPANNRYGDLRARLEEPRYAGSASWHKPPHLKRAVRWDEEEGAPAREASRSLSAWSGLLGSGTEKVHARYWVSAGEVVRVSVPFVRGSLVLPIELSIGALGALGLVLLARRRGAGAGVRLRSAARYARTRLPVRLSGWYRRQTWTRRRAARAVVLAGGFLVVGWLFVDRAGGLLKVIQAAFAASA
jgi:hypothetical protein